MVLIKACLDGRTFSVYAREMGSHMVLHILTSSCPLHTLLKQTSRISLSAATLCWKQTRPVLPCHSQNIKLEGNRSGELTLRSRDSPGYCMTLPSKLTATLEFQALLTRMKHHTACSSTGLQLTAPFCFGTSEDGQVDTVKLQTQQRDPHHPIYILCIHAGSHQLWAKSTWTAAQFS